MPCSAPCNCKGEVFARGLCASHYERFRLGLSVDTPIRRKPRQESLRDKIERTVVRDENDCWLWTGTTNKSGRQGYGTLKYRGNRDYAHHASWIAFRGEIPDGLQVLHHCDVKLCVNPEHLYLGTHRENMEDAADRGRMLSGDGHVSRLRPETVRRGETHPFAKLSARQVIEIKNRRASGEKLRELAAAFSVRESAISRICTGTRRRAG